MDLYNIEPNIKVDLSEHNQKDRQFFDGDKSDAKDRIKELNRELETLQELLYAEGKRKVLVVIQGMDTSGKDGTIRHVFEGVNPQGVKVASFKVPSKKELAHDYLWRVHKVVPGKGEIVIFNRSHYEDVLVVRVHNFVPSDVWNRRYDQINNFERMLHEEGTIILKFFLNISLEEQMKRFKARLDKPHKQWKFNPDDIEERKLWTSYMQAYEDVLSKTSTTYAPWFVIPADRKWYRNLVIGEIMVDTLKALNMQYPTLDYDPSTINL